MKIERQLGEGKEVVYAYYFPSQAKGPTWPHKIGKTKKDCFSRITQQRASMQEKPVIGTLIRCDNCDVVEKLLHFSFKKFKLKNTREWFDISPIAVENVWKDGLHSLNIHEQLLIARHAQRLTQTELSVSAGVRQETISYVETGQGNPSLHLIEAIANELGYKLSLVKIDDDGEAFRFR